jgi:endonuclease/exonuclease/phosphatase family metal-dependent hydrolase
MRVVSWNIQYGIETELAGLELSSTDALQTVDVLLLQEMDEEGTADIAAMMSANYAYTSPAAHAHTGRDFGNAVVTRWPIRHSAEIPLPHQSPVNGQPRSATHALVDVDGLDVSAYSVHTEIPSLRLARRIEQFDRVADDIRRRGHRHIVVGGDFNTVTARGVRALTASMDAADLRRVSAEDTSSYRRLGRDMMLDHVFSAGFDVLDAGVVESTAASDHLPIWIELRSIEEPRRRDPA